MKFGAFQISKSRNAKAFRGIVIIPTPHTPLEEFPLNRPYRITAATPYMVLHQAKPCLSEDNHGTTSLLATPTILHKYNLAAQPLRIGKAPTIRNRTAPTSPSVHAKARKQVIIDTRHRQWRQRPLPQAVGQIDTTKPDHPTGRVPTVPLSSRSKAEALVRRFHGVRHE